MILSTILSNKNRIQDGDLVKTNYKGQVYTGTVDGVSYHLNMYVITIKLRFSNEYVVVNRMRHQLQLV